MQRCIYRTKFIHGDSPMPTLTQGHVIMERCWILGFLILVLASTVAGESWAPVCEDGVPSQAGHRCHWPDAYLKCDCVAGAFCNTTTCQCYEGLTGDYCEQACPYTLADPHSCLSHCSYSDCNVDSTCRQTNKACYCMDGYTGPDCNLCDPQALPEVCALCGGVTCQNNAKCDLRTNTCHCPDGYLDPPGRRDCSYCNPRQHPQQCQQHCMYDCNLGNCDTTQGRCRCPKAYSGHDCAICNPEVHATQCRERCSGAICRNGGVCNIIRKACQCSPGFYGVDCGYCNQTSNQLLCSSYCQHTCHHGDCDTAMKQCICDAGYDGVDCQRCQPTVHPEGCQPHCPFSCINGGYCDTTRRQCVCPQGYLGGDCSICDPAIHLSNCTQHCPLSCINNATCDTLTTVCECLPGWEGQACHSECSKGSYGKNCSHSCTCGGWPCDHVTGECSIGTTLAMMTTTLPTTEQISTTSATGVFLPPVIPTVAEPGSNLSSTKLLETPSAIFLLAFFTAVLLVLIVLSAVLYARRHYKRSQFSQTTHEDVPLNNIVIPVANRNSVHGGDPESVTAETPLWEDTHRPLSNSFRSSVTEEGDAAAKPNPRKSTNLDVDAQRYYTKEVNAQNAFAFGPPKQQNCNIFNAKEASTKDKLKASNCENAANGGIAAEERLKKEALEGDLKKDSVGASSDDIGASSSSDQIKGAVGGNPGSAYHGGYERVGSDYDSPSSEPEATGMKDFPAYAQVDLSKKKRKNVNFDDGSNLDLKPDYQHLQQSIERSPTDDDPSYSSLEPLSARSVKDGYSKLEHGPKRKPETVRKMVNENEYEELRPGGSDSSETDD